MELSFIRLIGAGVASLDGGRRAQPASAFDLEQVVEELVSVAPVASRAVILGVVEEIWGSVQRSRVPATAIAEHLDEVALMLAALPIDRALVDTAVTEATRSRGEAEGAGLRVAAVVLQRLRKGEAGAAAHRLNEGVVFFLLHRLYAVLLPWWAEFQATVEAASSVEPLHEAAAAAA